MELPFMSPKMKFLFIDPQLQLSFLKYQNFYMVIEPTHGKMLER